MKNVLLLVCSLTGFATAAPAFPFFSLRGLELPISRNGQIVGSVGPISVNGLGRFEAPFRMDKSSGTLACTQVDPFAWCSVDSNGTHLIKLEWVYQPQTRRWSTGFLTNSIINIP